MIERLTTASSDDTTLVVLESSLIGFNGDGDWVDIDSGTKGGGIVRSNILVTRDFAVLRSSERLAGTITASVRIRSFSSETISFNILEGVVHETTLAAHVAIFASAVNQLLLRERSENLVLDLNSTFDITSGRESPAGTALTLVLDGGYSSLGDPIESAWVCRLTEITKSDEALPRANSGL